MESQITSLEALGFNYVSKCEREIPSRREFVKTLADSLRLHFYNKALTSPADSTLDHLHYNERLTQCPFPIKNTELVKPLKLLIVEDNLHIAKQLGDFLSGLRWQVDFANEGKLAVELASREHFDVVLLDLNLPDIDGFQVCRQIKAQAPSNVPILMLTARDAFEDKAQGFSTGADDYLTKPFDFREVALRCEALSRRQQLHMKQEIQIGALRLLVRDMRAEYANQNITLTQVGFKILLLLSQKYPDAVSRSHILHEIWGDAPPQSDALKSHIYSLRKQVESVAGYDLVRTVHNLGYQLVIHDDARPI